MDDILEILFINMFHGARLKSMPLKLRYDDGRNTIIRPLAYCREKDLIQFTELRGYPIIPCNLCGSQENLQRQNIKAMLSEWNTMSPKRIENIFKSLKNVSPSQLADTQLFDFDNLPIDRTTVKDEYEFSKEIVSSTNIGESLYSDTTRIEVTHI